MTERLNRVASYARGMTDKALNALSAIVENVDSPAAARVAAAKEILDRGWGKAVQTIAGDADNPLAIVTRIELVGVKPVAPPPY